MLPPMVLWIDPGLMTGLAWLWGDPGQGWQFEAGEYEFEQAGHLIHSTAAHGDLCWIGWERYDINTRLPQTDAHHAIEMIGVARYAARSRRCRVLTAAQQHTPKPLDRQRLQALGWWRPGKDDAQSAACHMLNWLLRANEVPPNVQAVLDSLKGA